MLNIFILIVCIIYFAHIDQGNEKNAFISILSYFELSKMTI